MIQVQDQIERKTRLFTLTISKLFVCIIMLGLIFLPPEKVPIFVPLMATIVLVLTGKISKVYLRVTWPLFGVLLLGILRLRGHEAFDSVRDIAYSLTPVALILIGFWAATQKSVWPVIMQTIVAGGVVLSIVHLSAFVQNPALLSADAVVVRQEAGGTGGLVVLALFLGIFHHRFGVKRLCNRWLQYVFILPVLMASFILTFSRTGFVQIVVFVLALSGALSRITIRSVLIGILIFSVIGVTIATAPKDDIYSFRGKLARSIKEVSIADYVDMKDINANWRGFETFRAVSTFAEGSFWEKLCGQGFGKRVDLGFTMKLGGTEFDSIPILHNGYAYVLVKTGVLGIGFYMLFYMNAIMCALRYKNHRLQEQVDLSHLLLGSVLCLMFSMFVVGGMAEIHDSELVLITGYLIRKTDIQHRDCS